MARTKKNSSQRYHPRTGRTGIRRLCSGRRQSTDLTSKMDIEMTRIREKYADQLAELSATKEKNFDIMQRTP